MFNACIQQYCACFDVEKEYDGEEDGAIWPNRPKNSIEKILIQGKVEGKRQEGQACKELVPGIKRLDKAGHGLCIPTGD